MTTKDIQGQLDRILSLDKESNTGQVSGMAGYGERFEAQKDHYRGLSADGRQAYEAAVLEICRMSDPEQAQVGLYICSELADLFPANWANRVTDLLHSLTEQGLPLAYHGAVSHAVIRLIRVFRIQSLIPFVHEYLEGLREMCEMGSVQRSEAKVLLQEISRTLISAAPDDFWSEFSPIDRDARLFSRSEEEAKELFYFWASSGVQLHGLDWLRKLASGSSKISDKTVRNIAYQAIRDEAAYLLSTSDEEGQVAEFLDWLGEISGAPDRAD